MLEQFQTVRTEAELPIGLLKRLQHFVDTGSVPSRHAFIVAAVEHYLLELERQEIDLQFEAMAEDSDYQVLNEDLAEAYPPSRSAVMRAISASVNAAICSSTMRWMKM